MVNKKINGIVIPRHDIAKNWAKAINFIPKKGELIVYDTDTTTYKETVKINGINYTVESSDKVRFKFGDGEHNVTALPFTTTDNEGGGLSQEQVLQLIEQNAVTDSELNTALDAITKIVTRSSSESLDDLDEGTIVFVYDDENTGEV